jgi:hypothetical protein
MEYWNDGSLKNKPIDPIREADPRCGLSINPLILLNNVSRLSESK